ncbi:MAG: phosphoserine phosphatase SerB [Pseudomonadota bacterium]
MDYVAVLVAANEPDAPEKILEQALDAAEIELASAVTRLGGRAAEAQIKSHSNGEFNTLKSKLAESNADIAILPAHNRRKKLLVCDMDSTIIEQECLDELADFAGLKEQISAITERAMAGELDFEDALEERVSMLEGLSVKAIDDCYKDRISLSAGARTLVATMQASGARCLLVSGGFTAFTERVAAATGFHEHHANTLLNDGYNLTGKVGMPILGREAKLATLESTAAKLGLSPSDALAMGDGANDLAMINAAGLGIAYRAKPVVATASDAAINHTDLTTALFYQGYSEDEFVTL